jgi:hypothetical protein
MSYLSDLTAHQRTNAHGIIAAVVARGWPAKPAYIAVEAALDESGMRVLASANVPESQKYPHDLLSWTSDGLGHDHASMGMFQQQTGTRWTPAGCGRAMNQTTINTPDGWGAPAELMDPEKSTAKFLNALAGHDWQHMTNWEAAQAVQGSAFPDGSNYRNQDARARAIVDALWVAHTTDTGGATALPTTPASPTPQEAQMYEVIQDRDTRHWYAYNLGVWRNLPTMALLNSAINTPLCVNAKACRARHTAGYQLSHAEVLSRQSFALGK